MINKNALFKAVADYKEGNDAAFEIIYNESSRYLYACICKIMKGNDNYEDACNDILQDTYVQIVRKIGQLNEPTSFLSWAGAIANSRCFKYLEKNQKYIYSEESDELLEDIPDEEALIPESVMQDKEQQKIIRNIIDNELTPMQRLCIIGYYFNDQKQSEIADGLGIPENTVKTNLSRAKKKLREAIEQFEKKEQTRLHSFAPVLLLLLDMDMAEIEVPKKIAENISVACMGTASLKAGKKAGGHTIKKIAKMSMAKKACATVATVAVVGTIGAGAYSHKNVGDYEYDTYYIYRDMSEVDDSDQREMPSGEYTKSMCLNELPEVYLLKEQIPIYDEAWVEFGYTKENIYVRAHTPTEGGFIYLLLSETMDAQAGDILTLVREQDWDVANKEVVSIEKDALWRGGEEHVYGE